MYQLIHTPIGALNRAVRSSTYTPRATVQHFNGQRLIPNRGLVITEEELKANLEDLKDRMAKGLLAVCTMSGERVDLDTLVAEEPLVTPPEPHFPSQLFTDEVSPIRSLSQSLSGEVPFDVMVREMGAEPAPEIAIPESVEEEAVKDQSTKRSGNRKNR